MAIGGSAQLAAALRRYNATKSEKEGFARGLAGGGSRFAGSTESGGELDHADGNGFDIWVLQSGLEDTGIIGRRSRDCGGELPRGDVLQLETWGFGSASGAAETEVAGSSDVQGALPEEDIKK
jgi:hypothetical protein